MKLPTLYKKTSTGALQFWQIESDEYDGVGIITTLYGQLNTDSPQETTDYIERGKNIGKKNETTPGEQAEAEAKAKHEKQLKKGYVDSIQAAEAGKVDDLVEGGIIPMLAHKFSEHSDKIKYPAYVQPKLDGIRCIAMLKNGKCSLWSRTRKPITGVPHISKYIEENFTGEIIIDGELYCHNFRSGQNTVLQIEEGEITISAKQLGFEHIVHLVRQEEPAEGHELIQYHIYDVITDESFEERTRMLDSMLFFSMKNGGPLVDVETVQVSSEEEVLKWFKTFKFQGYEGCMVRNSDSKYVNKRSRDLLKVKEFDDGEFKIVGIDEGRGKLKGHVGSFVCLTKDGKEFLAKMSGETSKLKEYFENHSLWNGKLLTVQFQGLTGANEVPRFPVGIAIRDYE